MGKKQPTHLLVRLANIGIDLQKFLIYAVFISFERLIIKTGSAGQKKGI